MKLFIFLSLLVLGLNSEAAETTIRCEVLAKLSGTTTLVGRLPHDAKEYAFVRSGRNKFIEVTEKSGSKVRFQLNNREISSDEGYRDFVLVEADQKAATKFGIYADGSEGHIRLGDRDKFVQFSGDSSDGLYIVVECQK